ncbi:MAG TPA: hypothetical protein VMN99_06870 [Anaerolineales bacterium]|nr:hypothetical protein [Anaerolineales bacterium]
MHRQRFGAAVAYARHAIADPQGRKANENAGAGSGRHAFEMAVSE